MENLLYGVAYYDEYMPEERLELDMQMIKDAGMNVIRIAESTWSSEEPENGRFDFSHVERALTAAEHAGISVIIGTPTYAIPPWLAAENPEILAITENGKEKYGRRQNMDIASPAYRFYAERVIRKLMECVQQYPNVIGFQLDNETKHYHTSGPNVRRRFIKYLRDKFGTTENLNKTFGLNYWSNRIDNWENVPDPTGTINGSFAAEFEKFRRDLVDEFLAWQAIIIKEYLKDGQFITHNFDYEWRDYSFGIQPDVNHRSASQALTMAGCDIYHLSQDDLTGKEIAFGGDICRSLKQDNYLVLETQAQGHVGWTPYDGQLRLQAFSHLASGANGVMYWHWHSIHNSFETYWKGLLSHDLQPNAPYREACTIGADFQKLNSKLVGLKKDNKVAILASNESLTGIQCFPMPDRKTGYNDIFRWMYDALYELNVECDIVFPEDSDAFKNYSMIVVPALYSASNELLSHLSNFVRNGGHLIASFKTGFSDENLTVGKNVQPCLLSDCFGIHYDQFTVPKNVSLSGDNFELTATQREANLWMELISPDTAEVISSYEHPFWGKYAAVTKNNFGKGSATYIGCYTTAEYLNALFKMLLKETGLWGTEQQTSFPIVIKSGKNRDGNIVHYYFNYSSEMQKQPYLHPVSTELLSNKQISTGDMLELPSWGFAILEERR